MTTLSGSVGVCATLGGDPSACPSAALVLGVRLYVGKKVVKHRSVSSIVKSGGTLKITIPKHFVKGKKIKVRASFVPSAKAKAGVASTSVKKTIKIKR